MKKVMFIIFLLLPLITHAHLPKSNPVPGGVINVPIQSETMPTIYFNKHRVLTLQDRNNPKLWHAVVGIPLQAEPGIHQLFVKRPDRPAYYKSIKVKPKEYELRHITIKNDRKVTPIPLDYDRIAKEQVEFNKAFRHWKLKNNIDTAFSFPVEGRQSSGFGVRRIYNNKKISTHKGLDIAAPIGTNIQAPAEAKVVLTGDFFFTGNTVLLDHGQGLITMYCHMNQIAVKKGQKVKRGQKLGTVGVTGRVTGPHLHWTISLNGAKVDPLLFIS